jgi:uncharacterized protein (TIGR00251 family)
VIVEVTAVPKSGRFSVSFKEGKVKVFLKSAAEQNKANTELVRGLSKALGREVHIISGQKSRRKRLEIDVSNEEWENFLLNRIKKS